jgi:hypothetical protein
MRTRAGQLSKEEVIALRGLRLPLLALKKLRQSGIYCDPAVSIQHQSRDQKYVIRGVESGGAAGEMGAYCSFVGLDGNALTWLQTVESVGRNGLHAVVIAPEMLRLQMFRNGRTYQLLLTRHRLQAGEGAKRPALISEIVFQGVNGTLEATSGGLVAGSSALQILVFRTRSGDILPVPKTLEWAVEKLAVATTCIGCKHCHLLKAQQVASSAEVLPV